MHIIHRRVLFKIISFFIFIAFSFQQTAYTNVSYRSALSKKVLNRQRTEQLSNRQAKAQLRSIFYCSIVQKLILQCSSNRIYALGTGNVGPGQGVTEEDLELFKGVTDDDTPILYAVYNPSDKPVVLKDINGRPIFVSSVNGKEFRRPHTVSIPPGKTLNVRAIWERPLTEVRRNLAGIMGVRIDDITGEVLDEEEKERFETTLGKYAYLHECGHEVWQKVLSELEESEKPVAKGARAELNTIDSETFANLFARAGLRLLAYGLPEQESSARRLIMDYCRKPTFDDSQPYISGTARISGKRRYGQAEESPYSLEMERLFAQLFDDNPELWYDGTGGNDLVAALERAGIELMEVEGVDEKFPIPHLRDLTTFNDQADDENIRLELRLALALAIKDGKLKAMGGLSRGPADRARQASAGSIGEARARLNNFNSDEKTCMEALRLAVQHSRGITPEAIDAVLGAMNHRYPEVRALAAQILYASWDILGDRRDAAVRIVNSKHAGEIESAPIIAKIKKEHLTGRLPEVVGGVTARKSISDVLRQAGKREDLKNRPKEGQFIRRTLILLRKGLICPLDALQRIESISGVSSQIARQWVGRVIRESCPSLTFENIKPQIQERLLRRLETDHMVIRAAPAASAEAVKQNMLTKLQRLSSSSDSTHSLAGMIASAGMKENPALLWWLRSAAASGPGAEREKARVALARLEMSGAIGETDIAQANRGPIAGRHRTEGGVNERIERCLQGEDFISWLAARSSEKITAVEAAKLKGQLKRGERIEWDYEKIAFRTRRYGNRKKLKVIHLPISNFGKDNEGNPITGHIGLNEGVAWIAVGKNGTRYGEKAERALMELETIHEIQEYYATEDKARELDLTMAQMAQWRDGKLAPEQHPEQYRGFEQRKRVFDEIERDAWKETKQICQDCAELGNLPYDYSSLAQIAGRYAREVRSALVVEDEAAIAQDLRRHLELEGYQVTVVDSADAGVTQLESQRYTIILTGLDLKDGQDTGEGVIAAAKAKNIPTIVLTAALSAQGFYTEAGVRRRASLQELGADRVFAKLVDAAEVMQAVGELTLPELAKAYGDETDIAQTAQAGAKKRVLVVDDNPMDLTLARTFLERAGYEVITATDGDKALELLREEHAQGRRVDIVVSDVQMGAPDSGYKLAKRLNEDSPSIPVILNSSEPIDEDGLSENVVATLRKLAKGADSLESKVTEVLTRDAGPGKGGMAQGAALAMTVPAKAKKVPLDSWHRRHAAAMPEFGGHDMPNRFKDNRYVLDTGEMVVAGATTAQPTVDDKAKNVLKGEAAEQMAARNYAAVWDISHMGFFEVSGENALAFLERIATRNVSKIDEGKMKYSFICEEAGKVIDEALIYNLGDSRYLVVVNAGNQEAIKEHLVEQLAEQNLQNEIAITHLNDEGQKENRMAALSVQGPRALGVLNSFGPQADIPLGHMKYFTVQDVTLQVGGRNIKVSMSRSGYAGEKGFEMLVPAGEAEVVWQALIDRGVMPCGLVSRDILRLEAGLGLMGHEIEGDDDKAFPPISPFDAGAGFAVDFDKDVNFIGKEALLKRKAGPHREVVNLVLVAKEISDEGRREDSFELNMPLPRRLGERGDRLHPASIVSVEKDGQWVEVGRITSDTVRSHTWRRANSEEDGFKDGVGITMACIKEEFAKPGTEVRIETKRGARTYIWYAIIYPRNLIDNARGPLAEEGPVPRPNLVEIVKLGHSAKDPHGNIEAVKATHNTRADVVVQQENEIIISEEWLDGFGEKRKQALIEASKESEPNDIIILPLEEAKKRFKAPLKPGKKQRLILLGQEQLTEDVIGQAQDFPECRILALENYNFLNLASAVDFGRSVLSGDDDSIREFYILLQRGEVPSPEMIERFKKDKVISLTLPEVEIGDIERIEELIEEHFKFLTKA